jgi:hypothetical protein
MNIEAYLKSFDYHHVVTYSFHRGQKLEEFLKKKDQEIATLEQEIPKARMMLVTKLQQKLAALKKQKQLHSIGLTDAQNVINETAVAIRTIQSSDKEAGVLKEIFLVKTNEQAVSAGIPVYRDAIAFYDSGNNLKSVLNICFDCASLKTDKNDLIEGNLSFFLKLEAFLKSIGHP